MGAATEKSMNIFKKYIYTPPASPSELIDPTTYVIDFGGRKFLNIGLEPAKNFDVSIQIITASRHICLNPNSMRRIYSQMGDILSVILDTSDKTQEKIFHVDDEIKLSKLVYREENMLVVHSQTQSGCRVLLNARDLIKIQDLEWCIFESITRKSVIAKPQVRRQLTEVINNVKQKITHNQNKDEIKIIVRNIEEEKFEGYKSRTEPCHISQLKLLACNQIAESCVKYEEMITNSSSGYLEHRLKMEPIDENDGPMWLNRYAPPSNIQSETSDSKRIKLSPPSSPSLPPSPLTYNDDYPLHATRWETKREMFI